MKFFPSIALPISSVDQVTSSDFSLLYSESKNHDKLFRFNCFAPDLVSECETKRKRS